MATKRSIPSTDPSVNGQSDEMTDGDTLFNPSESESEVSPESPIASDAPVSCRFSKPAPTTTPPTLPKPG